jgi:hypothetical protein
MLFEHKLFSFDLLSNIILLYVMIGYINVIYKGLDTFNFVYIPWGIWPLISTDHMHCFDIVEVHYPYQVMWQFEWSQHVPDYVDTGDELHNISYQGKREGNWLMIHTSYLDL